MLTIFIEVLMSAFIAHFKVLEHPTFYEYTGFCCTKI